METITVDLDKKVKEYDKMKLSDKFNTPDYIFKQLDRVFNFTLDAACDTTNAKCDEGFYHNLGKDGLVEDWSREGSNRVFCNPPFSLKNDWIKKAIYEVENNNCPLCVMILPLNCISANTFQDMVEGKYRYEVLRGRISFLNNETKEEATGNNTGTVIVYFMKKPTISKFK